MAFERLESRYFVQFENGERDRLEKVGDFCLCPARSLLGHRKVTYPGEGIGTQKIAALAGSILLFIISLPLLPIGLICTAYSGSHRLKYADVRTYFGQPKTLEYDRVTRFHDLVDDLNKLADDPSEWKQYLKEMDQMILVYPDGRRLKLHTDFIQTRSERHRTEFEIEQLTGRISEVDKAQIRQIICEADAYPNIEGLFQSLFSKIAPNYFLIAREKGTLKIIGVLAYKTVIEGVRHIQVTFLAKRLEYGKLGIGKALFSELEMIARKHNYIRIQLHVRTGNPAVAFYEAMGMQNSKTENNYYSAFPGKDALLMVK